MCTEQQVKRREWITKRLQSHSPMRACLGCMMKPRLGYDHGKYNETSPKLPSKLKPGAYFEAFTLYCPNCGFKVGPFMDLSAVISAWHRTNMPNDDLYAQLWTEQYERQMQEREVNAADTINED